MRDLGGWGRMFMYPFPGAGLLALGLAVLAAGVTRAETNSVEPVASNIRVVCDRWPDGSSLKQFAMDAIRLSSARTEEEKALAILRWVRRWTMSPDGAPPREQEMVVLDDLKILNVYGSRWADGWALLLENVWRSIGGRAYKLYVPDGYAMVMMHWTDDDGQDRWHQVYAFEGGYVYDRAGRWIATPDQLATDSSLMFRPSRSGIPRTGRPSRPWNWMVVGHRPFSVHNLSLDLRPGERYARSWGNEGGAAWKNVGNKQDEDGDHGSYPSTFGNGRLTSPVPLSGAKRAELVGGRGEWLYPLRVPHVMADAWVEGPFPDGLTVEYVPSATNCHPISGVVSNRMELGLRGDGNQNVEGSYSFPLRFSWPAERPPTNDLALTVVVKHNMFSLPQLGPGRNVITVSAALETNAALRVTYEWSDAESSDKRNVAIIEQAPSSYEILAAGKSWADVRCRQLIVEAIPATGKGNRTEIREPPVDVGSSPAMDDGEAGRKPDAIRTAAEYIDELKDGVKRGEALHALMVLRDKTALPALSECLRSGEDMPVEQRGWICQAIFLTAEPKEAFDILLPVLTRDPKMKWLDKGEGWQTVSSLIMHLAGECNYSAALPAMIERYRMGMGRFSKPVCLRAFGRMKARAAAPFCREALREHPDISGPAAWALGEIGDESAIPEIVRVVDARLDEGRGPGLLHAAAATALGNLKVRTPAALALLEKLLVYDDEEVRGMAAEALGQVGGAEHAQKLRAAAANETFAWVKRRMESAAAGLTQP